MDPAFSAVWKIPIGMEVRMRLIPTCFSLFVGKKYQQHFFPWNGGFGGLRPPRKFWQLWTIFWTKKGHFLKEKANFVEEEKQNEIYVCLAIWKLRHNQWEIRRLFWKPCETLIFQIIIKLREANLLLKQNIKKNDSFQLLETTEGTYMTTLKNHAKCDNWFPKQKNELARDTNYGPRTKRKVKQNEILKTWQHWD